MRRLLMTLTMLAGCSPGAIPGPVDTLCRETRAARTDHVAALLADGGDRSVLTGQRLVALLDAACGG